MKLKSIILIGILGAFTSCKDESCSPNNCEIKGTIQKQGITTYQYGTHVIPGYALQSNTVILDDYVDQSVIISGRKVDGYPMEGGPEYIEVEKVKVQ